MGEGEDEQSFPYTSPHISPEKESQEITGMSRPHETPCSFRTQAGQAFLDPVGTPALSLPSSGLSYTKRTTL